MARFLPPSLVLRHGEEILLRLGIFGVALPDLNDGRDELEQEPFELQETWKLALQEIDQQAFDMRTVVVLVGHDHQVAVAESLGVLVVLLVLETHELFDVLDLLVLRDLVDGCIAHVQQLTTKRKDAEQIGVDDRTASESEQRG